MKASEQERKTHEKYEWVHIANDFLIAFWFLVGSIFFFYSSLQYYGTWLFVIGSFQMLAGPIIRVFNKLHVRNIRKDVIHW